MARVPYERKLLFADGARSLFPRELPKELYLGQSVDSGCHVVLDADDRAENLYVLGVTGVGKTFFLENIVFQNIVTGRPIAVFDPTGGLYTRILDFTAFCLERAEEKGHDVAALQERFLFLNAESASNTQRVNLLEPIGESIEETVDDNLKLFSRLFGSLDEQRRIYQTARGSMWVGVALNQLPEADRPEIPGCPYPLNLHFISVFLTMTNEERERLVRCLPNRNEHAYVRLFWEKFFSGYTQSQRQERIESTFNCLSFLAGNAFAGNVFDTHHTTLNIPELLEHQKSLFVKLSLGRSLKGSQVIAAYLLTKFQRAATRRPLGHRPPYDVVVDEIGEFGDAEFAKALSTTRQFGLHFFVAHQASDQPPFDTPEGRAWLNTMRSNAATKVIFRVGRPDAELMTKELFELTQQRHNFTYQERSDSLGHTKSRTKTVSFQKSVSDSRTWQRSDSVAIAMSETFGIAKTEGVNLGETLTQGFSDQLSEGISDVIAKQSSETITEAHSKSHGLSVLIGKNWSHVTNHNSGLTFTTGGNESLAVLHGTTETDTETEQSGSTNTTGRDVKVTSTYGNSFVKTKGKTAYHHTESSKSSSTAMGRMSQHAESSGNSYSDAVSEIQSIATAIGKSHSETKTTGSNWNRANSETTGTSDATGGNESETITENDSVSTSRAKLQGISNARGKTLSISKTHQESLSRAFGKLLQFSESYAEALQRTATESRSEGGSHQVGTTEGVAYAEQDGTTTSESVREHKVFFTLDGEREFHTADLQRLPTRHAVVTKRGLAATEIKTYFIPKGYYQYRNRNMPLEMLQRQQERYALGKQVPAIEETEVVRKEDSRVPSDENSPWDF